MSFINDAAGQHRVKLKPLSCIARRDLRLLVFFFSLPELTLQRKQQFENTTSSGAKCISHYQTFTQLILVRDRNKYLKCARSVFSRRAKGFHTPSVIFNQLSSWFIDVKKSKFNHFNMSLDCLLLQQVFSTMEATVSCLIFNFFIVLC